MKNKDFNDERLLIEKRKIQSNAFKILFYILIIIIFVKKFLFNLPDYSYLAELIAIIFSSFYITIKSINSGIYTTKFNNMDMKKTILRTFISCIITVTLYSYISGTDDIYNILVFAVFFLIFNFSTYLIMYKISKNKQKKIDDELDRQEDDIEDELDKKDDM